MRFLIFVLLLLVFYAKYQANIFEKNGGAEIVFLGDKFREQAGSVLQKSFWFYDFFGPDHLIPRWFNMVRDNELRVTSVFVSPIIFAQFLSIIASFLLAYYVKVIRKKKFTIFALVLIALYGIVLSQVRAGLIFLAITSFSILIFRRFKQYYLLTLSIPLLLVALTFFGLLFLKAGDASSVGRIAQYKDFFNNFSFIGYGLGEKKAIIHYDSLVISSVTAFGLLGLLYFKLHLILIKKLYVIEKLKTEKQSINFLGLGLLGCFSAFAYFIFFHYSIGSTPLRFLYFISFYFLYMVYEDRREK
ncbi:hypothetical protein [Ascidiimonas aurantiaca]|uniref:hypothetical protein n=1 Tax=Ascidiimonas aurantiaca TaxID=1685432 RepID=UPI0030EC95FA